MITSGRTYQLEDNGDSYEVHLIEDGQKVGGVLFDIGERRPDDALDDAVSLGVAFVMRYDRFNAGTMVDHGASGFSRWLQSPGGLS